MKLKPEIQMVEIHNAREYVREGDVVNFAFTGEEKSTVVKILRVRGDEVLQRELTIFEKTKDLLTDKAEWVPIIWGISSGLVALLVINLFR